MPMRLNPAGTHLSDCRQPGPELVTAAAIAPSGPEQLPLLRMLEIVRDRVESLHAGQKAVQVELKEIRKNLPQQRRPLSTRTQDIHVRATWARRNSLCPCCQDAPVCSAAIRLDGGEFDHRYSRAQNLVTQTWLVCRDCNQRLLDTGFKAAARSAFEAYQMALRPFLGNRQMALRLMESPTGKPGWRHKRKQPSLSALIRSAKPFTGSRNNVGCKLNTARFLVSTYCEHARPESILP
ncbi:MAG: hypothetical protein JWN34_2345 [Bryobacterales bacterium]|nr:hypothetical protein [Bryobacterales bacterium]